jgi:hypothetical protein
MEKFARHALAEGVSDAYELHVTEQCELYKVLNQHYNRQTLVQIGTQIVRVRAPSAHRPFQFCVPHTFRHVVEVTLREFFTSIQTSKDADPSWKKQIYKVIARLDEPIPDYFKSPHFVDQLE